MNTKYQEALTLYNIGNLDAAQQILEPLETNNNPDHLFFLGVILSKKGELKAAIDYYKKAIQLNPSHIEAIYNLALCLQNTGQDHAAITYYEKSLSLDPFLTEAHNNLGIVHKKLNKLDDAEKHFRLALNAKPDNTKVVNNLAGLTYNKGAFSELKKVNELFEKKDYEGATSLLKKVQEKYPDNIEVMISLGTIYFHQGKLNDAISIFNEVAEIDPQSCAAYYSLGVCYQNQDENNLALKQYNRCLEIEPDHLDGLNNLGLLYSTLKDYGQAEYCFRKILDINPDYFNAYTNLGSLLINQDKFDEAYECFIKALNLADSEGNLPNKSVAYSNLGFIQLRQKKLDEAIDYFDKGLELNPESVLAHYNKAETLLLAGRLSEAWPHYEYRTGRKDFGKRHFKNIPTSLNELKGKRILVYAEQGLGDAFQFIRYIPLLKKYECYIIFECDKSILGLLKSFPGIDELIERNLLEAPVIDYDYDLPLLTIPLLFNTSLNTIPAEVPYLFADEEYTKKWNTIIGEKKFRVGIVWAGNPTHSNDRHRSVKLHNFLNLFSVEGTRFFSLQKGFPLIQAKDYQLLLTNLDDYGINNFSDTAGILSNLDLLITVDTSVAHIAGAMGIPVWILLPYLPDWRWMLDRKDSPWYPSVRLFRQPFLRDWDSVFCQLKKELILLIKKSQQTMKKNKRDFTNFDNFLDVIQRQVYAEPLSQAHSQITELSLERLLNTYKFDKNVKILDIGCGQGPALEIFRRNGFEPTGITLSDEDVEVCRVKGFTVQKMDQSFLEYTDSSFDLIWARHVLEHSTTPLFTLSEYYRVARSNSVIYIEVPGFETDAHHETNPNHYSIFPRSSWRSLITKAGFLIEEELQTNLQMVNGGKDEYYIFICRKNVKPDESQRMFLGLSSGENFGWGVCSKYLKKELSKSVQIINLDENPELQAKGKVDGQVFHALTNDFEPLFPVRGNKNYGYTFFEYELSEKALKNCDKYDLIFAGSTWNFEKLKEKGINNTAVLIQGIDPELFYPEEKQKYNDLFVIFSGGKFELRKGQDLVLKAFKVLSQKYPDVILINAWYNMWPETVKSMYDSKYIKFEYTGETWKNFMIHLCKINEIDGNRVFTLPITPNEKLREVYLNSDIGLFPNRCEGGTNLVLMEYMACGKPVIASYNTGHRDVLSIDNSIRLMNMNEFKLYNDHNLIADWTEPELDEIVERLEYAYHHREEIKAIGKKAADSMQKFTWSHSAESLLKQISE